MNILDILSNPPAIHQDSAGQLVSWQLDDEVLHYIYKKISDSSITLETGAGISTIMFAMNSNPHICIVPDELQVNRILSYCEENHIGVDNISFIVDYSENVLPQLDTYMLDLVLIDGRHAFPTPFIDWYYSSSLLKVDGRLVIDDTHLWTGKSLKRFLLTEPEWELENVFSRSCVFKKLQEGSHTKSWIDQPFLIRSSKSGIRNEQLRYIYKQIKNRNFNTLIKKILRT